MKALIIDDEPHVITVVRLLVPWEQYGIHSVLSCGCAEDARDLLQSEQPQIIISDINLPGLSGLDLIEELRENNSTAQVILITAYSDFAFAQRAVKLGCVDYLLKPLSENALNEAVSKAVSLVQEASRMQELLASHPAQPVIPTTATEPDDYPQDDPVESMNIHQICKRIHAYMEDNYREEINLDMLAESYNISPAYLSRSYKKEMGIGLIDDLTKLRLREACRLMDSGLRTSDIAQAVGIPDPKYFSRVFKKFMHMSPAEYREVAKGARRS